MSQPQVQCVGFAHSHQVNVYCRSGLSLFLWAVNAFEQASWITENCHHDHLSTSYGDLPHVHQINNVVWRKGVSVRVYVYIQLDKVHVSLHRYGCLCAYVHLTVCASVFNHYIRRLMHLWVLVHLHSIMQFVSVQCINVRIKLLLQVAYHGNPFKAYEVFITALNAHYLE